MTAHPTICPRQGVLDIAPYVGGESTVPGANRVIKLSSNENPFGPSPAVLDAYLAAAKGLALYPDGGHLALRRAIAGVHGLEAERIVCGAGSDELIALLCKAYAGAGDEVLYSRHGFLMYRLSALAAGATPVAAPERDLTADVDALIGALSERTRLVFLANPNNPTGTMVDEAALARLAGALPPRALLVLDAAYAEYVRTPGHDGGIALVRARDNVVMTRTFSKIHGLAALRLGWAYGPAHVIDVLNRVRGPFNVTATALAAGEAAIGDADYVEHCAVTNEVWRDWLAKEVSAAGFGVTPSHGNFILVETGERTAEVDAHLKSRGLIVRQVAGYGLPGHLRISIGDEVGCRAVADALRSFGAGS
ncbi:MAG: histidinol-phosphate transaminase [Proteobacteria bacterium]|nr:histidinol-phosphate transaminase [Pseudomonadota bacterium]